MTARVWRVLEMSVAYILFAALFSYSNPPLTDQLERVRAFTRDTEFNYLSWMSSAALGKLRAQSVDLPFSLSVADQKLIVTDYLQVTQQIAKKQLALQTLFSDPSISDKESASANLRRDLNDLQARQSQLAPLSEAILQEQVSESLAAAGLTTLGQPLPNLWFHVTPLPFALIVSPRDHIAQLANVSLATDLPLDQQASLEDSIYRGLNQSALVVPVGGVGVYPTMVEETTNLPWLLSTISHEWTHNYLTWHPLGALYSDTPELRTMNETTADIVGEEIGGRTLKQFYPELGEGAFGTISLVSASNGHSEPGNFLRPPFDFRAEMHTTRVTVDAMLSAGRLDEAEAYMESRRQIFLQHGYLIRKLNQAYFAFYGAYADVPGGAAGEDPVGPAVRALRAQSKSLADFIHKIMWMTSFKQLQDAIAH